MQRREMLALDLAVRLGDQQRARDAAQRLFGLRLDAETQVALAGQMRRLGMRKSQKQFSPVPSARRAAVSALAVLMGQYQAHGNMELAAQVAHQILRRSRTASAVQTAMGYWNQDSQSRKAALTCLAQAGKLKELIAGVEQQLERASQATQLYETLAEYYEAAGETQKMLDLHAKIVWLRPDDAELAVCLRRSCCADKVNEACDQYLVVIKKQARLLGNRYWEVAQAFQRANREADLARVIGEIDLKSFGQPWMVSNMVNSLLQNNRIAGRRWRCSRRSGPRSLVSGRS